MGDTAGIFTSKARFIPLGIAFGGCRKRVGFIRFEKGEIFWKKTKGTAEGTSKDLDNSVIKLPCANRLVILYPFVYIVLRWMNSRSINCNHLNGFIFYSRCIFSLNMFLGLKSVAKDLKMDLGRVVVITAKSKSENSLSFRAPIVLFWSEWVHLN